MTPLTDDQRTTVEQKLGLVRFTLDLHGIPQTDDNFQDGVLGLIRAVQLYDPQLHNCAFATYARRWIANAVRDASGWRAAPTVDTWPIFDTTDTDPALAVDDSGYDDVDRCIDAAGLVERLGLSEDDIALLTWPTADACDWFGINATTLATRRFYLRKTLRSRIEACS